MDNALIKNKLKYYDEFIRNSISSDKIIVPEYLPEKHVTDIAETEYYKVLIILRHSIKLITDFYFTYVENAYCVDLFMYTPSISSPIGSGSDSEPIPFRFGLLDTFLVDSSQFGFEPLLINDFEKVYCYLPSMRGENPDKNHLNQFYHCEIELKGNLDKIILTADNYIKFLASNLIQMSSLLGKISTNANTTINQLKNIIETISFPRITFEDAVRTLEKNNFGHFIKYNSNGNDLTLNGEIKLSELLNFNTPFWIVNFDRDRVPFYQKPDPNNSNKVLCADLIVPQLFPNSFGGELLGAGQRQDSKEEMLESLKRQNVNSDSYKWYIELRTKSEYETTSGFGMGIERFVAWLLGLENIRDAIIYPRIKNVKTFP